MQVLAVGLLLLAVVLVFDSEKRSSLNTLFRSKPDEPALHSASAEANRSGPQERSSDSEKIRPNPTAGENWRSLVELIPPSIPSNEVKFASNGSPTQFAQECCFFASIWARRHRLSSTAEKELAAELLAARSEKWEETLKEINSFEHEGKVYYIAGPHLFNKELQPQNLFINHSEILEVYSNREYPKPALFNHSLRDLRIRATFEHWLGELINSYFGIPQPILEVPPSGGIQNQEPTAYFPNMPEDEVLLLLWFFPEIRHSD
ncbi:hypothetical protein N8522_00210 [Akkermansiaceae bacterium]|nr:hypothetical protein [Akkermansiaceae bacterium]MDB4302266.1 hypothetical protein [bacterium]MDA8967605.1 hypothetical protein [Akkermansiaceae bacterium]MDB4327976.1 hypothetical protein [Akkermansiaceae bacterium]MDB4330745.1 hypothetical protein [Akkermansiaceae bacterium]